MCQTYNVLREKGKIVSLAVGRLTKGARSWLVQILGPQLSIFPIFIVNFDETVLGNSTFQIQLWSCRMGPRLQQKIFKISFWTLGGAIFRVWTSFFEFLAYKHIAAVRLKWSDWLKMELLGCPWSGKNLGSGNVWQKKLWTLKPDPLTRKIRNFWKFSKLFFFEFSQKHRW